LNQTIPGFPNMAENRKKIAVIGAGLMRSNKGPSGLVAIKECKAHGFDVTCFEGNKNIGGLWNSRQNKDSSLYDSVVVKTSKE
jgi:cation diffusion facilitator CzcD-associated flavoprotein CzcO